MGLGQRHVRDAEDVLVRAVHRANRRNRPHPPPPRRGLKGHQGMRLTPQDITSRATIISFALVALAALMWATGVGDLYMLAPAFLLGFTPSSALVERRNAWDAKSKAFADALAAAKNPLAGPDRAYDDEKIAKALCIKVGDVGSEIARIDRELSGEHVQIAAITATETAAALKRLDEQNGIVPQGVPLPDRKSV